MDSISKHIVFSSLVALRAEFSLLMYRDSKKQSLVQLLFLSIIRVYNFRYYREVQKVVCGLLHPAFEIYITTGSVNLPFKLRTLDMKMK